MPLTGSLAWPRKASSSLPLSSVRDIVMTSCDTGSSTLFACLTFFPVVERCCDKLPGPNPVPGCHPCKSKRNCGTVVLELCGQNSGKGAVISLAGASPFWHHLTYVQYTCLYAETLTYFEVLLFFCFLAAIRKTWVLKSASGNWLSHAKSAITLFLRSSKWFPQLFSRFKIVFS